MFKNQTQRILPHTGFVLIYTVLLMGIILLVAGVAFDSVFSGIQASKLHAESLKAFYTADAGIECVRYFQNYFQAFDTTIPEDVYNCGVGDDFRAGGNPPTSECVEKVYTFRLEGFSNGACTDVRVTTVPRTILIGGSPVVVCDLQVLSNGKNSCSASGANIVERTRWEDI